MLEKTKTVSIMAIAILVVLIVILIVSLKTKETILMPDGKTATIQKSNFLTKS